MISSLDRFWKAVGRWESDESRIVVEYSSERAPLDPSKPPSFGMLTGTVARIDGRSVTFRGLDVHGKEDELTVDFTGADIRPRGYEKINADSIACVFGASWDFARCTLTELRAPSRIN
jgi:hypothetical protein